MLQLAEIERARATQPGLRRNIVARSTRFAQSEDLLSPLVPRLARELSHIECLHHPYVMVSLTNQS